MRKELRKQSDGVIKGTLFLTISTIIVKLLGVIYKIPLSNYLGDEGMGYFNSAYTVFSFFYIICTAGVPKAVMILTDTARAEFSKEKEEKIIKTSLFSFMIIGGIMTVLLIILSPFLSSIIGNKKSMYSMISIAPSILFVSVAGVIRGKLTSDMDFLTIAISQIIDAVGRLVLGLLLACIAIKREMPAEMVSALTILGVSLGAFLSLLYLNILSKNKVSNKKTRQNNIIALHEKKSIIKKLFSLSIPITLSASVMSLTNIIDLAIIMRRLADSGYTEPEAAGLYGNYTTSAVSMFNLAIALVTPISVAFLPIFSRYNLKGDRLNLISSFRDSLKLSMIISSPIMFGLIFYGKDILTLLFTNTDVTTASMLLIILAPAIFFMTTLLCVNSLLEALGEVKAPLYSMLSGSLVKIVLCWFLCSNPSFGIYSAPIGTVSSYAVSLIVSMIILVNKQKINLPIITSSLPPIVISLTSIFLSLPVYNLLNNYIDKTISIILIILFVGIIYIIVTVISGSFNIKELNKIAKYTKTV